MEVMLEIHLTGKPSQYGLLIMFWAGAVSSYFFHAFPTLRDLLGVSFTTVRLPDMNNTDLLFVSFFKSICDILEALEQLY